MQKKTSFHVSIVSLDTFAIKLQMKFMKNVPSDMNVTIPQVRPYVQKGATQHYSDRPLVRSVILVSTVHSQQLLTNVKQRWVSEQVLSNRFVMYALYFFKDI